MLLAALAPAVRARVKHAPGHSPALHGKGPQSTLPPPSAAEMTSGAAQDEGAEQPTGAGSPQQPETGSTRGSEPAPPAGPISSAPGEPKPKPEPPQPAPPPEPSPEPKPTPEPKPPPPPAPEPESEPAPAPEPEPTPPPAPEPEPEPAPIPLPGPGNLIVGIDGGHGTWSDTETTYRAQLDAAVTRHEWDTSEPVGAQDALVLKAASQVHTRIHALLGENELGDATHYREWVVAFIRRYGLGGTFWKEHPALDESRYAMRTFELGNEPYFGGMSASLYADTVRPALEEVHQLGLPAEMILDSRVYGTDTSWMDTLYQRIPDLNSLFYAFADHPYWYGHDPAESSAAGPFDRIETLRTRMNEQGAGSKPIFITEYGESTADCGGECVSEAVQAQHLQEMIAAVATHPQWRIEMLSLYQLIDRGTNSSERELEFGLLREDGTEKPAYPIVQAAVQNYRG